MSDFRERIRMIMEHEGLNARELAAALDVQASAISHILSGRNNPGLEMVQRILIRFPEISADWMILGEGPMTKYLREQPGRKGEDGTPPTPAISRVEKDNEEESVMEKIVIFYSDGRFKSYDQGE
ncbi:MAG: helix-turn-helix transcriptional regulator [Bacteroidales bacterium]|nr:helix-turn-helix transcriptional regulator [Bacteroidales bacterium]